MKLNELKAEAHQFEREAYNGYFGYSVSMSDGICYPISKKSFVLSMRREAPLSADYFFYQTDFKPSAERIAYYNVCLTEIAKAVTK